MPYSNVPKRLWPKMDDCVESVMADQKLPKPRAIAVCHASIMGNKKKTDHPAININFYGSYWDDVVKGENFSDEAVEEVGKEVTQKDMAKTKKALSKTEKEVKKQDEVQPEAEAEVVDAPAETPAEAPAEAPAAEPEAESEESDEEESSEPESEGSAGESPADVEEAAKVSDLLKTTIAKIDQLLNKEEVKKADEEAAPAEGADSQEEAPEGGEEETPAEEEADASPGGAEIEKVVSGVNASLEKISGQITKFETEITSLGERLSKIEEQPVPSKVQSPAVVVSKGGVQPESSGRLAEINKELGELDEMRKKNLDRYQRENKWQKAIELLAEKDNLMAVQGV